ncbi:MAG: hypothetical protein IPH09_01355 [bacterium]|nr:hypothetical protein [bacterium]
MAGLWIYDDLPDRDLRLMWGLKRERWQSGPARRFRESDRIADADNRTWSLE